MTNINLYKLDEYPVAVCNEDSELAMCVGWLDVEKIIKYYPEVKDNYSIIGNLRSAFGVNIILYNLARNPHIKGLVVWANDSLSNTDIGKSGKEALFNLWKDGELELVSEIDKGVVKEMIKRIKLIECKDKKLPDVNLLLKQNLLDSKKVKPIYFPEFKIKTPDTLPSEIYTYIIREPNGASGFARLLHTIWKYGEITKIDTEGQKVKEIRGAVVVVENEGEDILLPDWLLEHDSFGVTKSSLDEYVKTQFSDSSYKTKLYEGIYSFVRPRDYSYLYAELLFAFPRPFELDTFLDKYESVNSYSDIKRMYLDSYSKDIKKDKIWIKRMEKKIKNKKLRLSILREKFIPKINQLEYAIQRIKDLPVDLDKEINLWDVRKNVNMTSGRPCLNKLSISVRNGKLDLHAFFRSHDIGKAWFYNYYGIRTLQKYIAKETNYKCGYIIIESESAHIYERDFIRIEKFVNDLFTNKTPRMFFDPDTDSDKRGSILIKVVGDEIIIILQNAMTGEVLLELRGKSCRELIFTLRHHDLISSTDHALFIGSELAKAEICLKNKIPYKYDSQVKIGESTISS